MSEYSLGLAELGTAVDMSGLNKGIDDAESKARGGFSKIGDILSGALKVGLAGAVVGFVALGGAIAGGVGDAREAAQLLAQTNATITSTGGAAERSAEQITDLATALSASAGASLFGDSDVQMAENLLLTFTNIKGAVFDAATAISVDMAQALGGAPKDQAIALGKALNDPVAGVTALSRVGVTFTEEQKEQIKVMQEAGDMAGAQGVILAELNKEFGGSAAAAAAADGGWAQFNDRMGEAGEQVGAALLPLMGMLSGFLLDTIVPAVESAAAAFSAWLSDPTVQANIAALGEAISTGVGVAMTFISETAIPALLGAWAFIQPALQIAGDFITGTIIPAIGALAAWLGEQLPGVIAALTTYWNTTLLPIFNALVDLWTTSLQPALSDLVNWLGTVIPPTIQALADFWTNTLQPAIATVAQFIAEQVIPKIGELVTWLRDNLPPAIQTVSDFWTNTLLPAINTVYTFITQTLIPTIQNLAGSVFGTLNQKTEEVSSFWTGTLQPALNAVWSFLDTYVIPLFEALANVAIALVKKEVELLSALWTNVLQPALKTVWDFIQANIVPILKDLVNTYIANLKTSIQALSDLWEDALQPALKTVAGIIKDTLSPALAGVKTSLGYISDAAKTVIRWFGDLAGAIDRIEIPSWLKGQSPPPLADWLTYIGDAAADVAANALPALGGAITDIVGGIQGILTNGRSTLEIAFGAIASQATEATEEITDAFLGGDIGDALYQIGQDALDGFGSGMRHALPGIMDIIDSTARTVEDAFNDAFDSHSPSQRMMPVGENVVQGILSGFQSMWPALLSEVADMSDELIDQVGDIGRQVQGIIGDAFGATASIDRQIISNLDKLKDITDPFYRQYAEGVLKQVQQEAEAFADPVQGAKYFKMRSDQILEMAALQTKVGNDLSNAESARIQNEIAQRQQLLDMGAKADSEIKQLQTQVENDQEKIADRQRELESLTGTDRVKAEAELKKLQEELAADQAKLAARQQQPDVLSAAARAQNEAAIKQLEAQLAGDLTDAERAILEQQKSRLNQAHMAEISAFNANQAAATNPIEKLIEQINLLFNNPERARLEEEYAKAKTDEEREQIRRLLEAITLPVNDTGIGHELMLLLQQLQNPVNTLANAYAHPPPVPPPVINIDARGSNFTEAQIEAITRRAYDAAAREADARRRTS
jgi:hypothetical protein